MEVVEENHFVIPGDVIGRCADYECGLGCYTSQGNVIATLVGEVILDTISATSTSPSKERINVISTEQIQSKDAVIEIGDVVLARVLRLSVNQVSVEIISVGDRILRVHSRAMIRREDIRLTELDSLVIHECFRPGDIVRAMVISLGDAKQYFLSTAEAEFGVRWGRSDKSGLPLVPVSCKVS
jgi:exosome complex component CSL4